MSMNTYQLERKITRRINKLSYVPTLLVEYACARPKVQVGYSTVDDLIDAVERELGTTDWKFNMIRNANSFSDRLVVDNGHKHVNIYLSKP